MKLPSRPGIALLLLLVLGLHASAAEEAPPAELKVMTFNIRNSGAKDGANDWSHRRELYVATVRAFNPDLLGTQEVLAGQFDDLKERLTDYTAVGVARDDGVRAGEWSAVFFRTSRFDALESGTFWLSETPEKAGSISWESACVRICSWARLRDKTSKAEFLYANTHFDHRSERARVESAKLLATRLPELAKNGAVILSGDFNTTETGPSYAALVPRPPEGGPAALTDSYREMHPEKSPDEASFHGFKGTIAGARIDWILHTSQFQPVAAEIVRPAVPPYPSDHYPVTAVFRVKP